MQDVIFYVAAGETLGVVRDYANAKGVPPPTFVRGVEVRLRMRLFAGRDDPAPYPPEKLAAVARWQWAMDSDFNESTSVKLAGDSRNIQVSAISETVEGAECEFTEISIPMPEMNTAELLEWLGTERSKSGLHGELVGFDENGRQVFVLQIENFTVRNRITGAGSPTAIAPEYMTIPQIEALFTASMDVQLSEDGEEWTTVAPESGVEAPQNYRWYRFRNSAVGDKWSAPVPLLVGPRGYAGTLAIGEVTQEDVARVENTGDGHDAVLNFALPKGDKGDAATVRVGSVATAAPDRPASVSNSGTEHDAVLDFTVPKGDRGDKGDKGDAATFTLGEVRTGAPGSDVAMTNTGTEQNAVLSFTIPQGDRGECTYLRTAWAWDSTGAGFSLAPSPDRKYRAELLLTEPRDDLTEADFAGCVWQKCLGDDGASFGAVAVTDMETSIPAARRIVFRNATVETGDDGEAVVTFSKAGASGGDVFNNLALLRRSLATGRSGGGSPGGGAGMDIAQDGFTGGATQSDTNQSTWEA